MPVQLGKDKEGCFARWGFQGAKYHYECGDSDSRNEAKEKAYIQGIAIGDYAEVTYKDYPKAATENARKALDWIDKYGRDVVKAGTRVGLARANQLANREPLSRDTIARMASFARQRGNSSIDPKFKGKPWLDKGYVAWLLWGGDEGVNWAIRKLSQIDKK
jgi:hypothetical protein